MASIIIKDLETAEELDAKALVNLRGGCPWGMGGGVHTIVGPTYMIANPFDRSTLYGSRYPIMYTGPFTLAT